MKRNIHDLSHYTFSTYKMGRLMTEAMYTVMAGDSLSLVADLKWFLAPLRRSLVVSAIVDMFAFYVPMRHIYSNWETYIKGGYDEGETLATHTPTAHVNGNAGCYGGPVENSAAHPLHRTEPYNQIWNRYFRVLKLTPEIPGGGVYSASVPGYPTGHNATNSPLQTYADQLKYGYACARQKRAWSTGINYDDLTTGDRTYNVPVAGTADLDIITLEQVQKRYKSEIEREYFTNRYTDILKGKFGSGGVNTDADQRPTLLLRKTFDINGHDINGTGDANLGDFSGRGIGTSKFILPRRYFPEHGTVWLMSLIRFPTIVLEEHCPLDINANPDYISLSGEADLVKAQPPIADLANRWFMGSGAVSIGNIPYGQEWREHPPVVHRDYRFIQGYPFIHYQHINSHLRAAYVTSSTTNEYDEVFSTLQLGHAQSRGRVIALKHSTYPTAMQSIYAGVN